MKALLHRLRLLGRLVGLDPILFVSSLAAVPYFLRSLFEYQRLSGSRRIQWRHIRPILLDRSDAAGSVSGHYFLQDLWAARRIFARRPKRHLDIGSRIDGFVGHILTFMPVTVVDVRPLHATVSGLSFIQSNATHLTEVPDNSVDSLSSLHAVEHFGLGRYGDPIEPEACYQALGSFARVLAPGGRLYLSVPVGQERVEFNAQRVFKPQTVLDSLPGLVLAGYSYIDDAGRLIENAKPSDSETARYACGLFELTKPQPVAKT